MPEAFRDALSLLTLFLSGLGGSLCQRCLPMACQLSPEGRAQGCLVLTGRWAVPGLCGVLCLLSAEGAELRPETPPLL